MNVNLQKNVFRCNRCDASGGMLELYRRLHGVSSAEANRQIREALGKGEYRTDYQVVHKEEPVEIFNAELADADVIDRTYQEMLSLLTLNDKQSDKFFVLLNDNTFSHVWQVVQFIFNFFRVDILSASTQ